MLQITETIDILVFRSNRHAHLIWSECSVVKITTAKGAGSRSMNISELLGENVIIV
jgi:hypothetical protein